MAVQWNLSPLFCEGAMGGETVQASSYGKALYMAETQEKSDKGENCTFST